MIRVMIVEDEPPIAKATKVMIEKLSSAFTVVGCESNGQAALLTLEEVEVDVIFTDIRMPVMDGLALLERVIILYPNCLSVIISGHQDFSYAQRALRLGAFDYLLKPLAPDKLLDLLNRLEDAFTKSSLQPNRGKWDVATFHSRQASKQADCWVFLACAGNWPVLPDDTLVPGAIFWKENNPEKLIRRLLKPGEEVLVLDGKVSSECVFILRNINKRRFEELTASFFTTLNKLSNLAKTLYLADKPVVFWESGQLIRSLRSQLYLNNKLCTSQLFVNQQPQLTTTTQLSDLPLNELVTALYTKNSGQLDEILSSTVDSAINKGITQQEFLRFFELLINDSRLPITSTTNFRQELNEAISNAETANSLKAELFSILSQFTLSDNKIDRKSIIKQIEQYLQDNYAKSISNEMLAARFGFVPSYISKIFRAQNGLSPSEYLTKLRIEKAKMLLSNREDLLIRQVGRLVGYNDPYYFSKAFKKLTGLWPTEYQQQSKTENQQ